MVTTKFKERLAGSSFSIAIFLRSGWTGAILQPFNPNRRLTEDRTAPSPHREQLIGHGRKSVPHVHCWAWPPLTGCGNYRPCAHMLHEAIQPGPTFWMPAIGSGITVFEQESLTNVYAVDSRATSPSAGSAPCPRPRVTRLEQIEAFTWLPGLSDRLPAPIPGHHRPRSNATVPSSFMGECRRGGPNTPTFLA